jgi:hypothetical protein
MFEDEAWLNCHFNDLWIFDKLILSKKLGYTCGPIGVDVSKPGYYIIRPSMNCMGMGRGATFENLEQDTDALANNNNKLGYFWCEVFEGRHISVDYITNSKSRSIIQGITVEGFRNKNNPLWKWDKWVRIDEFIKFPKILYTLQGKYNCINCEFIGGKLIEIHLRPNPDMGEFKEIIPVWEGELSIPPKGYTYVKDKDYNRLGFFKR